SPDVPVKEISFASPTNSYALPKAYELVEDAAVNEYHHGLAQTYESQLAATAQAEATFQSEVETLAPIEATIEALGDEAWCKYINPGEASHYIGEHVCLDFYVAHTRKYGQQVFLNSHYPYEGYFYVYIHQDLWNCWPQPPEVYFYGKWVRVWGTITEYYADWPEIILESCDSIQLLR
ncbi:MAG: hypothetical protein QXP01_08765, partial [Candidatus Hadarchaeum sp.]